MSWRVKGKIVQIYFVPIVSQMYKFGSHKTLITDSVSRDSKIKWFWSNVSCCLTAQKNKYIYNKKIIIYVYKW